MAVFEVRADLLPFHDLQVNWQLVVLPFIYLTLLHLTAPGWNDARFKQGADCAAF
jgi:hypothetical protein